MYAINVRTYPVRDLRKGQLAEFTTQNGVTHFAVAEMFDQTHEFLVAIQEIVEKQAARFAGIKEHQIDAWDLMHEGKGDPAELPGCPYAEAHELGEAVARMVAVKMGVDWKHHLRMRDAVMNGRSPLMEDPERGIIREHTPRRTE